MAAWAAAGSAAPSRCAAVAASVRSDAAPDAGLAVAGVAAEQRSRHDAEPDAATSGPPAP